MYTATISAKGQITIPARVRKKLGVKPNDKVVLIFRGDEVILKPLKGDIKSLRGIIPSRQKPEDFEVIREKVKQEIGRKKQGKKV
ncbi:MAG: AbrB/MazE/SpoVT family DNA-binding domain-containing protein [Calditrichaeota bacterium]|nr:AbrB/MazE/SpoVT family DNA-binding domain-containing protein [Calditrichota bacterium]